jgi:hypothetical protein
MLVVATLQLRDPMVLFIKKEVDDATFDGHDVPGHATGLTQRPASRRVAARLASRI